jgi:hypothetical protein
MAPQQQVISTVCRVAGAPLSILERAERNLTKAGLLPDAEHDWFPEDAAAFLLEVAAARSPGEAVDAIAAYRSTPLIVARFVTQTGFTPLVPSESVPAELRESPIAALTYFLGGVPMGVAVPKSLRLACHRSTRSPFATLYAEFDQGVLQLDYGSGLPIARAALIPVMIIPPKLIAAVGVLFSHVWAVSVEPLTSTHQMAAA